jgi:hypothetical protein
MDCVDPMADSFVPEDVPGDAEPEPSKPGMPVRARVPSFISLSLSLF